MSDQTSIEWTDCTWNFIAAFVKGVRGWFCTKRTKGCAHCYAEAINLRLGNGLEYLPKNLDQVEFRVMANMLEAPLRWRAPRKVFVNSMTDFFHPAIPDWMRRVGFAVMMCRRKSFFQILTKQPEHMEQFFQENTLGDCFTEAMHRADDYPELRAACATLDHLGVLKDSWPLANVAGLVSIAEQADADLFMPILQRCPLAIRGLSVEPLLGPVNLIGPFDGPQAFPLGMRIKWVIVGGESGSKARPCNIAWIRSVVQQCRGAGVPCFVKQLGAFVVQQDANRPSEQLWPAWSRFTRNESCSPGTTLIDLHDPKGGDPSEWPEDLRVREFP